MVFLDTSAILSVLDADDQHHAEADAIWQRLLASDEKLCSTNYVLIETFALVQRRLGMEAVRAMEREIIPLLEVSWMSPEAHQASVQALLAASRRSLSLVDCSSFEIMRHRGLHRAFAFDKHYEEQGFELLTA
jgi:predicted nucleic acid-binding protein